MSQNYVNTELLDRDKKIEELLSSSVKIQSKPIEKSCFVYNPRLKIEDQLLHKYSRSQARISSLRLKQKCEEIAELQEAPRINNNSKEIASLLEGKRNRSTSSYASQIVSTSKSTYNFIVQPKQSFIDLSSLNQSQKTTLKKHNSQTNLKFLSKDRQVEKEDFEIKRSPLEYLKQVVSSRASTEPIEEPQEKLYEMTVLQRNEYWNIKKKEKLQKNIEKKISHELGSCTFTPALAPKQSFTKVIMPHPRDLNSYAERNKKKHLKNKEKISHPTEKPRPSNQIKNHTFYKPISPHIKTLSGSSTLSLLASAKPMLSYRT